MVEPGCFGIPSVFTFKSRVCQGCKHFKECQSESHSALLSIKNEPFVADALNEHTQFILSLNISEPSPQSDLKGQVIPLPTRAKKRFALSAEQMSIIESVPKKIGAFLQTVWSKGLHHEMLNKAKSGQNPFDREKNRPYYVAYKELTQDALTKARLVEKIQLEFGWGYSAAYSQVSIIWKVLPLLGITKTDGAYMTLNM